MPAIPCVGQCFVGTPRFLEYLEGVTFNLWRPRFIVMHHTGVPNRAQWDAYQTRNPPISDEQWMRNLARYYGVEMNWSAGPHFFVTPMHICVLSPPNARGVHAASFNALSWGVEVVGDFDREPFAGMIRDQAINALAALHIAAGLQPLPFQLGQRGLHFHRDDPRTRKSCPGKNVDKAMFAKQVADRMVEMTEGDHPDETISAPDENEAYRAGTVASPDDLNVRAQASGRAPIVGVLKPGAKVGVQAEAMNGATKWYRIGVDEWVAARFVTLSAAA